MKKILFIVSAGLIFLSSCSKSKKEILTSTTWMAESVTAFGQNLIQECMKDDYFYFSSTGKVQWTQNGAPCSSTPIPFTPDFVLSEDEKTLTLSLDVPLLGKQNIAMTVEELTETRMRASASSPIAVQAIFVAKK